MPRFFVDTHPSLMKYFALTALFSLASAHGSLNSPKARGYRASGALEGPCGKGFENAGSTRTTVKASGFKINLTVGDENAKIVVNAGTGENPKSFPYQVAAVSASLQRIDIPIDFSKIEGVVSGLNTTLQVVNTAADGVKYVCADIIITL